MAFVNVGELPWPGPRMGYDTPPHVNDGTSVHIGDYVSRIFRPQPGLTSISRFYVYAPTGDTTYGGTMSLETVDPATGIRSFTLADTSSKAIFTFSPLVSVLLTASLDQPASVDPNKAYAFVVSVVAGSFQIARIVNMVAENQMLPYNVNVLAGVTSRNTFAYCMGLGNPNEMAYLGGARPITSIVAQSFNVGSSPNQYGAFFYYPANMALKGVELGTFQNVGNTDILLLNDAGTTLAQASVDGSTVLDFTNITPLRVHFPTMVTVSAFTTCRLFLKPTDGENSQMYFWGIRAASTRTMFQQGAGAFYRTSRIDNGGATDEPTQVPFINLIIGQIDDGSGGSGSVTTITQDSATGSRFGRGFN